MASNKVGLDPALLRVRRFSIADDERTKTIVYGSDGRIVPSVVCAFCGILQDLAGKNRRDMAASLHQHLKKFHKVQFNEGVLPTKRLLEDCMGSFLPDGVHSVTTVPKGFVVSDEDSILVLEMVALFAENKFKPDEQEICISSWLPPNKTLGWDGSTIKVKGFYRLTPPSFFSIVLVLLSENSNSTGTIEVPGVVIRSDKLKTDQAKTR